MRKDLIGNYIGDTEQATNRAIQRARGGVLFIDEAYTLSNQSEIDLGHVAMEVILKAMDELRDEIVFIFAGYSYEMKKFLEITPGVESRIGNVFHFADYTPKEIKEITIKLLQSSSFTFSNETEKLIEDEINRSTQNGIIPGNARWARSFTERILEHHRIRISDRNVQDVMVIHSDSV